MRIAVLLPAYNPKKDWLLKTIDSVLDQKTSHEIELFIRFDGDEIDLSPRKGLNIIKDRIRRGIAGGCNFMINHIVATSWNNRFDYIGRIDADDSWHEDKIEKQVGLMVKNGVHVCGTWGVIIDENGKVSHPDWTYANYTNNVAEMFMTKTHGDFLIDPSVLIDARLLYDGLIHFNNAFLGGAEYELWLRLACMGFKFESVPERLYFYRQHSQGQNTKKSFFAKTIEIFPPKVVPMYQQLNKEIEYFVTAKHYESREE